MNPARNHPRHNGKNEKPLIFVVDDEPMLLELASVILQPLGYALKTFRDPDSAVKSFARADPPPALIITDYAMHTMNGMDLINECRRLKPQQKIILVSGTVNQDVYRHSPIKPDLFLAKPYHPKQLVDAIESVLSH
jgi:CheY-like chemotaxis protein